MSKWWLCGDCGSTITDDQLVLVDGWRPLVEDSFPSYTVCPHCGSDNIEPAGECKYCGDVLSSEDNTNIEHNGVCDACLKKATAAYNALVDALPEETRTILESVHGELKL